MRALGIDYGRHRIGLSLSDPTMFLASPFGTITNKGGKTIDEIMDIIKNNGVGVAVVGLALLMDGNDSEMSLESRAFGREIANRGVTVEYEDERWTTKIATNIIKGRFHNNRRGDSRIQRAAVTDSVDKIAASVILQSYLDKRRNNIK
jgi:putative Holliday junction resolvase